MQNLDFSCTPYVGPTAHLCIYALYRVQNGYLYTPYIEPSIKAPYKAPPKNPCMSLIQGQQSSYVDKNLSTARGVIGSPKSNIRPLHTDPPHARIHETTCFHAPTYVQAHKAMSFHDPMYVRAYKASCVHDPYCSLFPRYVLTHMKRRSSL